MKPSSSPPKASRGPCRITAPTRRAGRLRSLITLMAAIAALLTLARAAAAQEAPRRFDLTCDAHSADGVNKINATLRFAVDLDAGSMRAYRDGKLQPPTPIQVTDQQLVLRDGSEPPFAGYSAVHVRESVDRRTGAFVSDMDLTRASDGGADQAHSEGQCAFARYSGADGKPLY